VIPHVSPIFFSHILLTLHCSQLGQPLPTGPFPCHYPIVQDTVVTVFSSQPVPEHRPTTILAPPPISALPSTAQIPRLNRRCFQCTKHQLTCIEVDDRGHRILDAKSRESCTQCVRKILKCREPTDVETAQLDRRCNICRQASQDGSKCSEELPCQRCLERGLQDQCNRFRSRS
jgi:hypothetical protein